MANLICHCGHQNNSHNEDGCNFDTCVCEKFRGITSIDDEKIEQVANKLLENIQEKLNKLEPSAFKKNIQKQVGPKSIEYRKTSQSEIWDEVEAHWDKVDELTENGEYQKVDEEIDVILGIKFENISAWIKKGRNYVDLECYEKAILCFKTALILDNNINDGLDKMNYMLFTEIGAVYAKQKFFNLAINYFKDSLKIKENYIPALNELATCYREEKLYELAIKHWSKLLSIEKNDVDAWDNLGWCYVNVEKLNDAIECFETSKQLEKNDDDNYADVHLADCYLQKNDLDHAEILINYERIRKNETSFSYKIRGYINKEKKNYAEALKNFEKQLSFGYDSDCLFQLAYCNGQLENFEKSLVYYTEIHNTNPSNIVSGNIAFTLNKLGRTDDAVNWLEQELPLYHDDEHMLSNACSYYRRLEKYAESIAWCDAFLEIKPNDAWILNMKGLNLTSLENYDDAIECYEIILSSGIHHDNLPMHMILNNFGDCYLRNREYVQGLKVVEQALEIEPTFEQAIDNKAIALRFLKRWNDAIEWYQKAFEISNDLFDLGNVAYCTFQLGNEQTNLELKKQHLTNAVNLYDDIIKLDEHNDNAYWNKANIFYNLEMYGDSRKNLEQALNINSKNFAYWGLLGDIEFDMKKYDESLIWYNKSLEINPSSKYTLNQKGLVLSELERHEESLNCFDVSRQLESDSFVLSHMGIELQLLQKYEEAVNYFEQSLKMEPQNKVALGNKSHSLRFLKKYEESLDCINELIKIEPDDVWNTVEKIKIYWDWKKSDDAIEIAEHALRKFPRDGEEILHLLVEMNQTLGNTSKQNEFEKKLQNLKNLK